LYKEERIALTCLDAIREVFQNEDGVLTTSEIVDKIYAKYADRPWKRSTIAAHLIGLSVNHPSSRHYPTLRQHAFLYSLGNGRYRRWKPQEDGNWVITESGVQLTDALEEAVSEENGEEIENVGGGMALSLERDLENSLISNLEQLEPGLRLYERDGVNGQQFETNAVGRLDILAVDKQGNYVVIELKAGEADDRVCGQILRYMGWVKKNLAEGKPVRGIIVANSFTETVKYAVGVVPNLTLKRYEVRFSFLDV
jgi:hypothetical protein